MAKVTSDEIVADIFGKYIKRSLMAKILYFMRFPMNIDVL